MSNSGEKPTESWGLIVVIILVGCLISTVIFVARSNSKPTRAVVAEVSPIATTANDDVSINITNSDPVLGSATAPVTVVEFSDFTCATCRQFHQSIFSEIKKNYIDTGKVRLVYKDFPVGENQVQAQNAAEAARCASAQGKFWEYADRLFQTTDLSSPQQFIKETENLGLNISDFTNCLANHTESDAVTESVQDAVAVGITTTPSFVINGKLYEGSLSYDTLKGIVESHE